MLDWVFCLHLRMFLKIKYTLLFLLISSIAVSQNGSASPVDSAASYSAAHNYVAADDKPVKKFYFRPKFGAGVGMLSFYGDMYDKHFTSPTVSKMALEANLGHAITDYLDVNIFFLYGKLSANERFAANNRNLNFESQITSGGINVQYDFGNFLKKDRIASPFISLGFEVFQFSSKTDLFDKNGIAYHYWTDGTIRNLDQNDVNATNAVIIQRDYKYETDIRALNADGFGNYPTTAFALPVGAGVVFNLTDNLKFKMGAVMHFTSTDYIDGITASSIGNRAGNSKKDNYLMSSVSLSYTFGKVKDADYKLMRSFEKADEDGDKVPDFRDDCPGTPHGVSVNSKGCPLDGDLDNVPNFKDDEPESAKDAIVDLRGVTLNDSLQARQYLVYMDSTGEYNQRIVHTHNEQTAYDEFYKKQYMVDLGTYRENIPVPLMNILLSIPDLGTNEINPATTMYTAGDFHILEYAEKRKLEMIAIGFSKARVVLKQHGKFYSPYPKKIKHTNSNGTTTEETPEDVNALADNADDNKAALTKLQSRTTKPVKKKTLFRNYKDNEKLTEKDYYPYTDIKTPGIVFRIQIGAFKERLPKSVLNDINNVLEIQMEDGVYRYTSGSYKNYEEANAYKNELTDKGYEGTYVTAYKDGVRITMKEAGVTPILADELKPMVVEEDSTVMHANKNEVFIKVQVGKFKGLPPADLQATFKKMNNVKAQKDNEGNMRYMAGAFTDYKQAKDYKEEIKKTFGIKDAFLVAYNKDELIPVKDAMKILAK
jgi:hypothetical protein